MDLMKAVTVIPGTAGSARLEEVPEPDLSLPFNLCGS